MNYRIFISCTISSLIFFLLVLFTSSLVYAKAEKTPVRPREFTEYDPLQISVGDQSRLISIMPDELKPMGGRVNNFLLFPSVYVNESYADNIFFSDNNTRDDFITVISPAFQIRSDWSLHEFNLYSMMNVGRYENNTGENFTDFNIGADAKINIKRDFYIFSEVFFSRNHQLRGAPDSNNDSITPTLYYNLKPRIGLYKQFNSFFISLNALFDKYDFKNDRTVSGSIINNEFQERIKYQSSVDIGYQIEPAYSLFVRGGYTKRDYAESSFSLVNRDSKETRLDFGLVFDFKNVYLAGNVQVGMLSRNFNSSLYNDSNDITYQIDLNWGFSRRLQFRVKLAREIQETTQSSVSTILSTIQEYKVDYEIYHDLYISYNLATINNSYRSTSRDDDILIHEIDTKYYLDKMLHFSMSYNYAKNKSLTQNFEVNMFSIGIGVSY